MQHLYQHLIPSLENVAPEKAAKIQSLIDENAITFVFDDQSKDVVLFANPVDKTITLGLIALERLWTRAYAYIALYEYSAKKLIADPTITDFELLDPVIRPAMQLLAWTVDVEDRLRKSNDVDLAWPKGLPRPLPNSGKTATENLADDLFLCAVGGILLHEVAHLHLKHDPRNLPDAGASDASNADEHISESKLIRIGWEKEADAWSANWMLDGLDPKSSKFEFRIIGIVLGYIWLASQNAHAGEWLSGRHPPSWDRIYQNIKQHVPDNPGHPIWLFVAYSLQLHLVALGQQPPIAECEDPEEWVNQLLDHVSTATV